MNTRVQKNPAFLWVETKNKINTISKGLSILVEKLAKLAKECYSVEMLVGGKVGGCGET